MPIHQRRKGGAIAFALALCIVPAASPFAQDAQPDVREYRATLCDAVAWAPTPAAACAAAAAMLPRCDRPGVMHYNIAASLSSSGGCTLNWDFTDTWTTSPVHWSGTWSVVSRQTEQLETPQGCDAQLGNPVVPATGEKIQVETDFITEGADPLSFERTYRSRWNANQRHSTRPALGPDWIHNHEASLLLLAAGSSQLAHVTLANGDISSFSRPTTYGSWIPANGRDSLRETASGIEFRRAGDDTLWLFDAEGRLLAQTHRNGWQLRYAYDANGLLRAVTNAFGRQLRFTWNANQRLASVTPPDGRSIAFEYDALGRLIAVTYPDGNQRRYHYEDAYHLHALTGITDESGTRFATWSYDYQGRAISSQHAGGVESWRFGYPASGAVPSVVTVTDPRGTARKMTYGTTGHQVVLTASDLPLPGRSVATRAQNAAGLVDSETDYLGVSTFYTWDLARRLPVSVTRATGRPEAQTTATQWHAAFALPVRITEAGRTTDTTYDALGNRLAETVTDTATGRSRTWAWTYDAQGLPSTATDPRGDTWRFAHDDAGNRVRSVDPLGHVTQFTHDAAGRVLSIRDGSGLVTQLTYTARGRLASIERAGESTAFGYTQTGQLASVTRPSGYRVDYDYDAAQRLVGARDNRGASVRWQLDAAGQRVREDLTDSTGRIARSTAQVFDALGRVVAVQGAGGQSTQVSYDANGEPVTRTDPLGQATRRTLDALRRTTGTTFADNASVQQAWNALDQLTQVTDPKGVRTQYETNAFGEVTAETSPDSGTRRHTRDAGGAITQTEDAKGQVTRFERDALGRATRIIQADGAQAVLAYDAMGNLTGHEDASGSTRYERDLLGRVITKVQAVNDNASNPSRFQVGYQWEGGELASLTYPSGLKVIYHREAGRITGIDAQRPGKRQLPQPWITALSHTALGQPQAWRWASGDSASRQFDADGRLVATEFARYGYDAAGRMTSIAQDLWARITQPDGTATLSTATLAWQAGYDNRDRLVRFTRAGQDIRYTYDANGNRLSAVRQVTSDSDLDGVFEDSDLQEATSQAMQVDAGSNRLLGFTQTVPVTSQVAYAVDANGSMISDGAREFAYDSGGRLARVMLTQGSEAASIRYLHNTLGQRVFKSEIEAQATAPDAATLGDTFIAWLKKLFGWLFNQAQATTSIGTAYVYGDGPIPEWALLGEYDNGSASGRGRTEYLWLPTEDGSAIPVGFFRGGQFFAVHPDHLGTPRLVTNDANEPVWQWPYSAFGDNKPTGVLKATPNPRSALTNQPQLLRATTPIEFNLRMPGQYHDAETGLAYNYWRSYCPACGRYVQADPIGWAGGWNRFNYSGSNPLLRMDPLGLKDFQIYFDAGSGTLWVTPPESTESEGFPAGNNTTSTSRGAWPEGVYRYSYSTVHRDDAADSSYGSSGNTVFQVPGCVGCGVHSGREFKLDRRGGSGVNHVTEGCIRTTDSATSLIRNLIRQGHTPVLEVTR